MTDTPLPPEDDAPMTMAAEFALGLLEGEERAAAMRRVLAEPGFAAEVERWRDHFGVMFAAWPEATAPADGAARIEAALIAKPVVANDNDGSALWKGIAGATSLAAAVLVGVLVLRPAPTPPAPQIVRVSTGPTLVAAIAPTGKGAPIVAVYDASQSALRIAAADLADKRHSAELWVIPAGEKIPHSLGVLRSGSITQVALRQGNRQRVSAGATLAITIEAPGGSPTGLPQGPVIAAGPLTTI